MEAEYSSRDGSGSYLFPDSLEFNSNVCPLPPEDMAWVDSCLTNDLEYLDDKEIGFCPAIADTDIVHGLGAMLPAEAQLGNSTSATVPLSNALLDRIYNLSIYDSCTPGITLPNHSVEPQIVSRANDTRHSLRFPRAFSARDDNIRDIQTPFLSADDIGASSGDVFQVWECDNIAEDDEKEKVLKRLEKGLFAISRHSSASGDHRMLQDDLTSRIQRLSLSPTST